MLKTQGCQLLRFPTRFLTPGRDSYSVIPRTGVLLDHFLVLVLKGHLLGYKLFQIGSPGAGVGGPGVGGVEVPFFSKALVLTSCLMERAP